MKLSVVIICWNDGKCILDCIKSVRAGTGTMGYEIVVADNGSTDGSVASIRKAFPGVRIVENGRNLGFGKGNNAGIRVAQGDYVLILNPDTIICGRALERLIGYADRHPEAGAFGCRVLNPDGSLQRTVYPLPTIWGSFFAAVGLGWLLRGTLDRASDRALEWDGHTERPIGFQAGCCLLVRSRLLKALGGFDERFFHQFEDADLCRRIWNAGHAVLFYPGSEIIHIGGKSRGNYPPKVLLKAEQSRYRYFHKYYGARGLTWSRCISLISLGLRYVGFSLLNTLKPDMKRGKRLSACRMLLKWHWSLDPRRFLNKGSEPNIGCAELAPISEPVRGTLGTL
jgi:N-acetylglucosaminyl-diphospho-decaprenol L-rhamnosyltransferase